MWEVLHHLFIEASFLKSSGFDQLIEGDVISYLGCCCESVAFTSVFKNKKAVVGCQFLF